jgi:SAM-dependent methyltransferase
MSRLYDNLINQVKVVSRPYRHGITKLQTELKNFFGYDTTQWARVVMYQELFAFLTELDTSNLDALEISPGIVWKELGFRTFTEVSYPEFDICKDALDQHFDIIIADQIFEHLLWPYRAGKNVFQMLENDGYFIITTPFLIRVHNNPIDCTRWTEIGLKHFLAECNFPLEKIITGSWGNRACAKENLHPSKWAERGWYRSLHNEDNYPIAVWAIARK